MIPNPRRQILLVLLLMSTTASFLLCFPSSGTAAAKVSLPRDYAAWSRVAQCESGGWRVLGSAYPDSLGITRANWLGAGGRPLRASSGSDVSLGTRAYEIRVADRFIAQYHAVIPDQNGCAAW